MRLLLILKLAICLLSRRLELRWLFLSDNLKEVRAAMASGMRSLPVTRPGNAPYPSDDQLAQFAIPDFSPESDDRIRASLHALEKLR